jgi:hypothetical protein
LKDVSSFANAGGGDLVYGIKEQEGRAVEICGLGEINPDQTKLRLGSTIRDGIAPRIPGIQTRIFALSSGKLVLIVRVPQSWAAPHIVTFQNLSRFFSRTSNGAYQLDVFELRAAFLAAEAVPDRIRAFRAERLARIVAGQTPIFMKACPTITLHVVPYSALRAGAAVDLAKNQDLHGKLPQLWDGSNCRINFDGLLNYSDVGYVQLFRNGAIESVDQRLLRPPSKAPISEQERKLFPYLAFERSVIRSISAYLGALGYIDCQPPVAIMLSLLQVEGLYISPEVGGFIGTTVDRPDLLVPEILVTDMTSDPGRFLRPTFDAIWNACGYVGSPSYDKDGTWHDR